MEQFTPTPSTSELHVPDTLPPISAPTPNSTPPTVAKEPRPRKRRWIWVTIGVVLAGLLGGGYFAYSRGYISIPFLTPKSSELVNRMLDTLSDINNAQYSIRVSFKAEPHQSKYKPFSAQNLNTNSVFQELVNPDSGSGILGAYLSIYNPDTILRLLPSDVELEGGSTFYFQSDVPAKDADAQISIDGTYTGGDISVAVDLEIRKIEETVYGIIRKFPSLGGFFDLSAIKEKWVEITPDDSEFFTEDMLENLDTKSATDNIRRSLQLALDAKVFEITNKQGRDTIAGVRSDRYEVQINTDKLVDLYQSLIDDAKQKGEDTKNLESLVGVLQKPEVTEYLRGITDNTTFEAWIDVTRGYLRQIRWQLVVVPPADNERLRGKQISMNITLTLDKVNQEVRVSRPSPTIDFDEATRLITGVSEDQQKFEKQRSRIENLRNGIGEYHRLSGSYPENINNLQNDLESLWEDCEEQEAANQNVNSININGTIIKHLSDCRAGLGYQDESFSNTDVYTGEDYGYTRTDDDYRLTYQMIITDSNDSYYKDYHVDGQNTATSDDISLEKIGPYENTNSNVNTNKNANLSANINSSVNLNTNSNTTYSTTIDSDYDGLKNYVEFICGTDANDADTDGDGYNDKTEILNNYNPRGSGQGVSTSCAAALQQYP